MTKRMTRAEQKERAAALEKAIQEQVEKGLRLATGGYISAAGKCACAVGAACVAAVARKRKRGVLRKVYNLIYDDRPDGMTIYSFAEEVVNEGMTAKDFADLEAGFEARNVSGMAVDRRSPFFRLGARLRRKAIAASERRP